MLADSSLLGSQVLHRRSCAPRWPRTFRRLDHARVPPHCSREGLSSCLRGAAFSAHPFSRPVALPSSFRLAFPAQGRACRLRVRCASTDLASRHSYSASRRLVVLTATRHARDDAFCGRADALFPSSQAQGRGSPVLRFSCQEGSRECGRQVHEGFSAQGVLALRAGVVLQVRPLRQGELQVRLRRQLACPAMRGLPHFAAEVLFLVPRPCWGHPRWG